MEKFKNHEIEKYYKCTVYGIPKKQQDTLEAYLFKDNKKSLVYIYDEPKKGAVKIVTSYNVLETNKKDNTSITSCISCFVNGASVEDTIQPEQASKGCWIKSTPNN